MRNDEARRARAATSRSAVSSPDRHGDGNGHASFTRRAVGRTHQRVGCLIDIGIRKHQHVVLGAAERLHAFAGLAPGRVDVLGNRGRADEAHRLDVGVKQDRIDRFLVTMNDVQHAAGQSCFVQQSGDEHRCGRIALGRLEDEGVAAGDGHRVHPQRNHGGKIERRNSRHDAQGLAVAVGVDVRADVAAEIALEQMGNAANEIHHLDAASDLAQRVRVGLAMLGADAAGDLLAMLVQQRLELEQIVGALRRRRFRPGRVGCLGRGDGACDVLAGREPDPPGFLAGGRIEERCAASAGGRCSPASDEIDDDVSVLLRTLCCRHFLSPRDLAWVATLATRKSWQASGQRDCLDLSN